mmetsp:Transcript_41873/g.115454  ORF Transcript_41873/g.115454 Transcript_41873/m.115454 type:complete len:244 (+) Transcript_41873:583-1314(+)
MAPPSNPTARPPQLPPPLPFCRLRCCRRCRRRCCRLFRFSGLSTGSTCSSNRRVGLDPRFIDFDARSIFRTFESRALALVFGGTTPMHRNGRPQSFTALNCSCLRPKQSLLERRCLFRGLRCLRRFRRRGSRITLDPVANRPLAAHRDSGQVEALGRAEKRRVGAGSCGAPDWLLRLHLQHPLRFEHRVVPALPDEPSVFVDEQRPAEDIGQQIPEELLLVDEAIWYMRLAAPSDGRLVVLPR